MVTQEKEVVVTLHTHSSENASKQDVFRAETTRLLEAHPSQYIVVVLEDYELSAADSLRIFESSKQKTRMHEEVVRAVVIPNYDDLSEEKRAVEIKKFYDDPQHHYLSTTLQTIDSLRKTHTFPDGNPRLLIAYETALDDDPKAAYTEHEEMRNAFIKQSELFSNGQFDQALPYFMFGVMSLETNTYNRDEWNALFIQDLVEDEKIGAIIAGFGAAHTHLAHVLNHDPDKRVTMKYEEMVDGVFYYPPEIALARKIQYFGFEKVTKLEMYKGLIGSNLDNIFFYMRNQKMIDSTSLACTQAIYTYLETISTMEDVRWVEKAIKDFGEEGLLDLFLKSQ